MDLAEGRLWARLIRPEEEEKSLLVISTSVWGGGLTTIHLNVAKKPWKLPENQCCFQG